MSPTPLERFLTWALLLANLCLSVQDVQSFFRYRRSRSTPHVRPGSGSGQTTQKPHEWLHRKEAISHYPLDVQQTILNNTLRQKNMELTGNVPSQIQDKIPDIIENLVNGAIDTFLSDVPVVGPLLGPVIKGGISLLKDLFGGGKVYIPNMPPVIDCPDNKETTQDRGSLSAVVTWQEPKGYDAEDGRITNVRRTGKAPGSRFSGKTIIQYNVADSKGRTDFCTFVIKVDSKNIYYGDDCQFSCPPGYTLKGRSALTCNVERQFDGQRPDCEHTVCSQPLLPMGGSAWDCSNTYKPSSVCRLKCQPGYQTARTKDGSEGYIQCAGDGSWTGTAECTVDAGAIIGAINEQKQELKTIKTILTSLVEQLRNLENTCGH